MSEREYEDVFHNKYKLSKEAKKDSKKYELPLDKQVRLQIALLHQIQHSFTTDIDFERREREIKQQMMIEQFNRS